jgi:TonB-dependent receptor
MSQHPSPLHVMLRVLAPVAALHFIASGTAVAQTAGTISGRVTGPDGNPVASASIMLLGAQRIAVTDQSGKYRIGAVPPGNHKLVARFFGFSPDTAQGEVRGGATTQLDFAMAAAPTLLSSIVIVDGERGGQIQAINQQRYSSTIFNVVSADDIGALPDQNVAEAVQRMAGISIQTSRGEGRVVTLRGTAPNLNNVTLNGQTLASTAETRATPLDLLPSAMVSSVEVTKAITPDMDANAIGGTVNITTITAFDRERPFMSLRMKGLMHQQQVKQFGDDKQPYEFDFTAGRRFGPDNTLGIVFSSSASRRDFTASVLDPDGWDETNGSIFPEELELQVEDNERHRFGFSTNLDWRPSAASSYFLRSLYTRTREVVSNSEYEFGFEGDLVDQTEKTGRYTGGSAELDLSEDDEKETLMSITLGGLRRISNSFTWDFAGTFTRGQLDRVGPDATFETTDEDRLSSSFDVTPYFFTITPDDPDFVANPANYPLRSASWSIEKNRENTWMAGTNFRFDTHLGAHPAYLKFGGKLQLRDKVIDDQSFAYDPENVDLAPYALPATGTVQGGSEAFVHGDVRRFSSFFAGNRNGGQFFTLDDEATALNAVEDDSDNLERITAGYLMGNADIGRLSVLTGFRVEHTRTEARRYEFEEDEDAEDIAVGDHKFSNSYTRLLPALVLRYDASENLVLRAAWTNTIGRADYEDLAGFRSVSYAATADPTRFEGAVEEGNPFLKPFSSSNLDASAEYYVSSGGLLSLGFFHKRIADPIYEYSINYRDTLFEGRMYDELEYFQDRNADAGTLRGVELAWSQPLFFLPAPLDGLGITANAAFINSDVTVPGREGEKLPFFGQSNRVINIIPYFQRGPVELRLAWTFRGAFLDEVGDEPFEDRYIDKRQTIDFSGRFSFGRGRFELLAQARNLTNEPEVGYQGIRSRYDVHTLTGRTFALGISAR